MGLGSLGGLNLRIDPFSPQFIISGERKVVIKHRKYKVGDKKNQKRIIEKLLGPSRGKLAFFGGSAMMGKVNQRRLWKKPR